MTLRAPVAPNWGTTRRATVTRLCTAAMRGAMRRAESQETHMGYPGHASQQGKCGADWQFQGSTPGNSPRGPVNLQAQIHELQGRSQGMAETNPLRSLVRLGNQKDSKTNPTGIASPNHPLEAYSTGHKIIQGPIHPGLCFKISEQILRLQQANTLHATYELSEK